MSGPSGLGRTKLRQRAIGRLGLSLRDEASVRLEPGLKPSESGFADLRPYQQVDAVELLSLLKQLQTQETSWSKVNPVLWPYIHPISVLPTNHPSDELLGLMVQLQPYIMPLNPISFEGRNMTAHGVTNSRSGGIAKNRGTSYSSD